MASATTSQLQSCLTPAYRLAARLLAAMVPIAATVALAACAVSGGAQIGGQGLPLGPAGDAETKPAGPAVRPAATKVAMLLPLSAAGQTGIFAKAMKQAGELALFELDDPSFQLMFKDDKGTPEGAAAAAQAALQDNAELIIGPLFSGSTKAAGAVAKAASIPLLSFSNDRAAASPGVYVMGFQAEQEVERIISFAASRGLRRIAALIPEDEYGRLTEAALKSSAAANGAAVLAAERFHGSGTAMLQPVRNLSDLIAAGDGAGAGIDALFVPGGPQTLATLGPILSYAKIDTARIKLLGTGAWDAPSLGRDKKFIGSWYPAPDPGGWQRFAETFAKTFGSAPPRIASLAFDGVQIAIRLSREPRESRYSQASLTRREGFTGIDGPIRLSASGTSERDFAVLEVQTFGATVADPPRPPSSGTFGDRSGGISGRQAPIAATAPSAAGRWFGQAGGSRSDPSGTN